MNACAQSSENIDAKAFSAAIDTNLSNITLLDVRTEEENRSRRIKGSINYNISGPNFDENIKTLDTSKPVYVYCLSGGRSSRAAKKLKKLGHTVYNLSGGINAWQTAGLPMEKGETKKLTPEITKEAYIEQINSEKPTLVQFYAPWCAPCKKIKMYWPNLESEFADSANFIQLDFERNETLAREFGVTNIPWLILYKNGKKVWEAKNLVAQKDVALQIRQQL